MCRRRIHGVDLREDLDDANLGEFVPHRRAPRDFFRDQQIETADHLRFARKFGDITINPFGPKHPDHQEVSVLDQKTPKGEGADAWHTDNTYLEKPPLGSILRAVQLPAIGGDTLWANMYAAYEAFSPTMQRFLDGLTAVHDLTRMLTIARSNGQATEAIDDMQKQYPPQRHPVVRTNPVTGRKALFVSRNWVSRIEGLTERENECSSPSCSITSVTDFSASSVGARSMASGTTSGQHTSSDYTGDAASCSASRSPATPSL